MPFRYAGQYRDAESGLYYLRARYYDPATAQFLTRDPLPVLSKQPYGCGADDPTNLTDPDTELDSIVGAGSGAGDGGLPRDSPTAGTREDRVPAGGLRLGLRLCRQADPSSSPCGGRICTLRREERPRALPNREAPRVTYPEDLPFCCRLAWPFAFPVFGSISRLKAAGYSSFHGRASCS